MMGPMGTRFGVLAGELWLVAGEDTGDDSLLSEDPAGEGRAEQRERGSHPPRALAEPSQAGAGRTPSLASLAPWPPGTSRGTGAGSRRHPPNPEPRPEGERSREREQGGQEGRPLPTLMET